MKIYKTTIFLIACICIVCLFASCQYGSMRTCTLYGEHNGPYKHLCIAIEIDDTDKKYEYENVMVQELRSQSSDSIKFTCASEIPELKGCKTDSCFSKILSAKGIDGYLLVNHANLTYAVIKKEKQKDIENTNIINSSVNYVSDAINHINIFSLDYDTGLSATIVESKTSKLIWSSRNEISKALSVEETFEHLALHLYRELVKTPLLSRNHHLY